MDAIEFLHGLGAELRGLNAALDAREQTLRYVVDEIVPRFAEALERVEQELKDGDNSARTDA